MLAWEGVGNEFTRRAPRTCSRRETPQPAMHRPMRLACCTLQHGTYLTGSTSACGAIAAPGWPSFATLVSHVSLVRSSPQQGFSHDQQLMENNTLGSHLEQSLITMQLYRIAGSS